MNTKLDTYLIVLNKEDKKLYRQYQSIAYLKNKVVTPFKRGTDDFLFCERLDEKQKLQFSVMQLESPLNFSNTILQASGNNLKVLEAIELEREDDEGDIQKFFRVTCVRSDEEIMCWEVVNNAKCDFYFSSVNS